MLVSGRVLHGKPRKFSPQEISYEFQRAECIKQPLTDTVGICSMGLEYLPTFWPKIMEI